MAFKPGQRIKFRHLRGTILQVFTPTPRITEYVVSLDNGARVLGTKYQFQPVMRRT